MIQGTVKISLEDYHTLIAYQDAFQKDGYVYRVYGCSLEYIKESEALEVLRNEISSLRKELERVNTKKQWWKIF